MADGAHGREPGSPARPPRWPGRLRVGIAVASVAELLVLIATDGWLPDGTVPLLANLAVLGALAAGARTGPSTSSSAVRAIRDPGRAPLGTRFAAAVLGWCLGALVVLLAAPSGALLGQAIAAAPLLLLAIPAPWSFGFTASGAAWGRRHWIAYGIASLAVLLAAPLVPRAGEGAAPLAFGLGIAATLPLIVVAFIRPLTEPAPAPDE